MLMITSTREAHLCICIKLYRRNASVSAAASQREGAGPARSARRFRSLSRNLHVRLTGDSEWAVREIVCVCVCENGCLSPNVKAVKKMDR